MQMDLRGKQVQILRCLRNCDRGAIRPTCHWLSGWEDGRRALIREPGDLPVTVVPQPGGVYRFAAWTRNFVGPLAMNGVSFMPEV